MNRFFPSLFSQHSLLTMSESADNNFHLIRILCAWGVLVAHSYILAGSTDAIYDPFAVYFGISTGTFCVIVFFAISGFLIQRSMLRSSSLMSFVSARALRLYPALAVVLLLTVFLLGPISTQLPVSAYFSESSTWDYIKNLNLLNTGTHFFLAGVFTDNPYPNSVNGSIWTLPYETWMYVMTALLFYGRQLILKQIPSFEKYLSILTLIGVSISILVLSYRLTSTNQFHAYSILLFISTFFIGANLYNYRAKITLSWWVMSTLLLAVPYVKSTIFAPLYLPFTVAYSILVLAYLPSGKIRLYNRLGDYSYGLYIYAFPVQQSIAHWMKVDFLTMIVLSTVISIAFAIASWHLIESPALKLKGRRKQLSPAIA